MRLWSVPALSIGALVAALLLAACGSGIENLNDTEDIPHGPGATITPISSTPISRLTPAPSPTRTPTATATR